MMLRAAPASGGLFHARSTEVRMTFFLLLLILVLLQILPGTGRGTARSAVEGTARTVTAPAEAGPHAAEPKPSGALEAARSERAGQVPSRRPAGFYPIVYFRALD
jgi:hypothetical protein